MKDQSRWLRGFELRRMLLTAIRERVHVALAEPILRIGAARQARLWLKKDSETIPPPCLNVPHACDGTASSVGGSERRRSYAANPCAPCVLPWVCAVTRRRFPVGASPTRQPLQPEATGAAMEVTKWLKPSECASRIGDGASVQAATRVRARDTSLRGTRTLLGAIDRSKLHQSANRN